MSDGELWSFIRCVLEQGAAIQQDYQAGKYSCYEEYAARVDEAARQRVPEFKRVLANAESDEPMFVLLARDKHAPALVERWAWQREFEGEDMDKVREALDCAAAMREWRKARR